MKFNICVAIPIKSGKVKENEELIKRVLETKPDLIEFRFDYIDEISELTPDFIKNLLDLVGPNILSIFTFRDPSEGGHCDLNKEERIKIIKLLIEAQPEYLDIEMNTEIENLREIINFANENVKFIFSYHDFDKTPSLEVATSIFEKFKDKLLNNHLVDFLSFKKLTYKLIFTAKNFEDNLIPIKLCRDILAKEKNQGIISFCMGELGLFSRITCVKFGSLLTYGSLEDKTAPGQINIKKIRELHQLLFNS
ncbi:MAG: type I 3-dehydroquinate dehydratase [Promethearchaeota archaeon]|nr:MAG: type I 3-dehydroquinate dehydratase [Candidatus Lokiarchaeota archaeon]